MKQLILTRIIFLSTSPQIIYERNGNLYGEKSNDILREILSLLEALPGGRI